MCPTEVGLVDFGTFFTEYSMNIEFAVHFACITVQIPLENQRGEQNVRKYDIGSRLVLPFHHFLTDFNNFKFFDHLQDQI